MSRKAKGRRPTFFDDSENDKLLAIVMALAGEVSVMRDRLDTVERLAERAGVLTQTAIEQHLPDAATTAAREAWRAAFVARLLRIVHVERESLAQHETPQSYDAAIAELSAVAA